jgi:sulfoxide reductase heme-binding subunit YedZ
MHHDPTLWLLARASGLTAYVLLGAAVLAGLTVRTRPTRRLHPALATEAHRTLALTSLAALALHGSALVLDGTAHVTLGALLVPGLVPYRPVAVAAGVVAAWLAATITASFWFRRHLGTPWWRRLHKLTYALFVLASFHGLAAGTDSSRPWAQAIYLGIPTLVAFATAWRVLPAATNRTAAARL